MKALRKRKNGGEKLEVKAGWTALYCAKLCHRDSRCVRQAKSKVKSSLAVHFSSPNDFCVISLCMKYLHPTKRRFRGSPPPPARGIPPSLEDFQLRCTNLFVGMFLLGFHDSLVN